MFDNIKTGNQITLLRKEKNLTGEKLAELLDVSPQAVKRKYKAVSSHLI